ncbi:hypothetical protein [Methanothermobacter sp. DP]|uniref:hypothetical protein n=1 Tax=unclassified Methanothermobacter TaxID=2631116 RepID=UPI002AA5BF2E|nr:hypothetical protein [Methanothermobacter sp. DP]
MRKSCLWGLLILFTLAVSFNAAAAAATPPIPWNYPQQITLKGTSRIQQSSP